MTRSHRCASTNESIGTIFSLDVGYLCFHLLRQLTKEQLVSVLPLLLNLLESQEVVVYTYAAVALDRILSMRTGGSKPPLYALPSLPSHCPYHQICRFSSTDVQRSRSGFYMSYSPKSVSRTVQSARRRSTCLCIVRVPFTPCVLCLINLLSRCCESYHRRETSARRGVRHCSAEAHRHPTQSRPKSE